MIVAGNWKMNLSVNEAIELSNGLLKHNEVFVEEKIIIFPSFLIIPEIYNLYKNSKISLCFNNPLDSSIASFIFKFIFQFPAIIIIYVHFCQFIYFNNFCFEVQPSEY